METIRLLTVWASEPMQPHFQFILLAQTNHRVNLGQKGRKGAPSLDERNCEVLWSGILIYHNLYKTRTLLKQNDSTVKPKKKGNNIK